MKPYFATLPIKELLPELQTRKDDFYAHLKRTGRLRLYRKIYDHYYKAYRSGGQIYFTGEQGEYTNIEIADFRNILLHLCVMTTNQRPNFEPRAMNTDTKSQAQVIVSRGILDYEVSEKKLDRYMNKGTESAIAYGEGYVDLDWNATVGNEIAVDPKTGKIVYGGDLEAGWLTPIDVPLDFTRTEAMNHDWRMTRKFVNKYVIASKYASGDSPEAKKMYEQICGSNFDDRYKETVFHRKDLKESDLVPVYTFYHRKNEAVPHGRMTRWISSEIHLTDGPLAFDEVPLYRIAAAEQDGTPFGYTIAFDLLPIQEAIDKLCSTVLTNQSTFGVSNILVPDGANLTVSSLADGLNAINYKVQEGKPEALNLTSTPAEVFKFIDFLRGCMQTLSGVNSVARGDPEASLKSGAALALVQSMAIQFNSGLQQSYAELASDVATGVIKIFKRYAKDKRVAIIAGKANHAYMKQWSQEDLTNINRVVVDLGNPLMRTNAGRLNLADTLLDNGKLDTAQQYIQVLTSGKVEPILEGPQAEMLNIRSENEALAEGKKARAIDTDNHPIHIREHKVVLSSPESRNNPTIVKNTLDHIQEHIDAMRSVNPDMLAILGIQPLPPAATKPVENPGNPGSAMTVGEPVTEAGVPAPKMPSQPKNPLTGDSPSTVAEIQ